MTKPVKPQAAPERHGERLTALAEAFNSAFGSHRRFPLDAATRVGRGERVSVYSGTPEAWTAALHVERDPATGEPTHTLLLTTAPLPPRMRERLMASATRFEEAVRAKTTGTASHKP